MKPSSSISFACLLALSLTSQSFATETGDPLPSWNDGKTKARIIDFVERVTDEDGKDYVPVEDRIATFDNDGTLWQEKPVVQTAFVVERTKEMAEEKPALLEKEHVKGVVDGGLEYLEKAGLGAFVELLMMTHGDIEQSAFETQVREFYATAKHPTLGKRYTALTYKPMRELLAYLRSNGFKTFISSGGGIDFMRIVSEDLYGIPTDQVVGSSIDKEIKHENGRSILWRKDKLKNINDKATKPVGIDLHIGKRPILAAGNEGNEGDIEMLRYSQSGKGPSLQLLVNHDDAKREFAYSEADGASLKAASDYGWDVISMKNDWKVVF